LDDDFQGWLNSLSQDTQGVATRLVVDNKVNADDVTLGWFVVELVGDEQPALLKFPSYAALVDHVRRRSQQAEVWMFCYWGAPIRLTTGQFKFLVHPNGERTALFRIPNEDEMEFDDEGRFTDTSDAPIGEVTELNLGGSTIALSDGGGGDSAATYDDGDFNEYEEESEDDYSDEEPANVNDDEDYDEADEQYDEVEEEDED
jgi:hypothetical protein